MGNRKLSKMLGVFLIVAVLGIHNWGRLAKYEFVDSDDTLKYHLGITHFIAGRAPAVRQEWLRIYKGIPTNPNPAAHKLLRVRRRRQPNLVRVTQFHRVRHLPCSVYQAICLPSKELAIVHLQPVSQRMLDGPKAGIISN